MAKRKRLEMPNSDDIDRLEKEFRSETSARNPSPRGLAPIAQIAADSASQSSVEDTSTRAERARTEAAATRLREAEEQGLLISEIPVDDIDAAAMIRDRTVMGEEEMLELRQSIASHGLRLPIEIFELETPNNAGQRFGLISGYRRLMAVRALLELTEAEKYKRIKSILRPQSGVDNAFISMVEENEVREELSHYERGRIAVLSANQGAFANIEDAVNRLYGTGSKAKRSKIRSFALLFEELGDMLQFPEALTEKRGLRLASALRRGEEAALRQALSDTRVSNGDDEWAVMEPILAVLEKAPHDRSRGGRPRSGGEKYGWIDDQTIKTSSGITIRRAKDSKGYILRLEGTAVDGKIIDSLIAEIVALLEK